MGLEMEVCLSQPCLNGGSRSVKRGWRCTKRPVHETKQHSRKQISEPIAQTNGAVSTDTSSCTWDERSCAQERFWKRLRDAVVLPRFWAGAWKNLKKSWFQRLIRATKLSSIIVLALYLHLVMSYHYLGTEFLLLSYSLCATLLPEYSSSLYSVIWVWLLSIIVTFLVTVLSFSAFYVGGIEGEFVALGVILVLFSWVVVMRIPLLYRVPPFREAIDSSYLGKLTLVFIPHNTCCTLLRLRNMMYAFKGIADAIHYLFVYLWWSMVFTLFGLALFAFQIATPPWNSQRAIVRRQLKDGMVQIAEALKALNSALDLLSRILTTADGENFPAFKSELKVATAAMAGAVAPLLHVLGSQSALRTQLVESGREPYWLPPGPGINVMPEMARIQMVQLQASMHLVGAVKQLERLVKAMEVFVVERSRALLSNVDEVRNSVKVATLVCKEGAAILALCPSHGKDQLTAAATRLHWLREHMEGVRLRSSLGHGPLTRQPSIGIELAERVHGLLHKTGALLPKGNQPLPAETGKSKDMDSQTDENKTEVAEASTLQQSESDLYKQPSTRKVNFCPSPEMPSLSMPDLYQPPLAETLPPCHGNTTSVKSRLRMLKSKALKRHKGPKGNTQLLTPEDMPSPANNFYINLPSLGLQSSITPSMSLNQTSISGSLFENASFFETRTTDANFSGFQLSDEEKDSNSLQPAATPVHISTSSRHFSRKAGDFLASNRKNSGVLRELKDERDSIKTADHMADAAAERDAFPAVCAEVKTNVTADAVSDDSIPVADAVAAERQTALNILNGSSSADDSISDPAEELAHLLELLAQDSCRSTSSKHQYSISRTSFRCPFAFRKPGKSLSGREARDAMADVTFWPEPTGSLMDSSPEEQALNSSFGSGWDTLEVEERPIKFTHDTKALRHQVKLTMLVVSLIQISSKDSLDFCAAFEALIYSDMTPTWSRFWLNIRMVFLSATIMWMQLSRGFWDILYFWKWRFAGKTAWFNDVDTVHCVKVVIGITGLYAVGVFADQEITMWLVGSLDVTSAVLPVSSWIMLGFLSTMKWTFEGTVHTATSRLLGTLVGCGCIYGAMMTTNNHAVMLAWIFILCFTAVFIFANPADVSSTFHPEFGVVGQVFLWTCLFIFQTVWLSMKNSPSTPSALKLNVTNSRLWGNVVGILTAVGLSYWPPCFSSETEVRFLCRSLMGDCSQCISLIGAAFVRSACSPTDRQQVRLESVADTTVYSGNRKTTSHQGNAVRSHLDTQDSPMASAVALGHADNISYQESFHVAEQLGMNYQEIASTFPHAVAQDSSKRGREAKWKRGCCGIGFLAMPETFNRTPVATDLIDHHEHESSMRHKSHKRQRPVHKKLRKRGRGFKTRHFTANCWLRHRSSIQLASSFECLQKATEVLHRSFEPKLFICRRLFLEGTRCPHSPLWWVDMSLGRVLDMMDYLRMSIEDSCQDFRDCLQAATVSDLNSPGTVEGKAFVRFFLLMQTVYGRCLRRRFVKLITLQKAAYSDIGNELLAGQVGCWSRMPAFSLCDCGRRHVSELYLGAAKNYVRRRKLIESTLNGIFAYVVASSRELRKQTGHSAQERRMALSVLLLLLHKIEMRHAVTDDIHMYIAQSVIGRAFPEGHFDVLLQLGGQRKIPKERRPALAIELRRQQQPHKMQDKEGPAVDEIASSRGVGLDRMAVNNKM